MNYYQSVLTAMGGRKQTESFFRLFMVPGMGHCGSGPGPRDFDRVGVLEQWEEQGVAPDKIEVARHNKDLPPMTRPLCPYPEVPQWNGSGSTAAANFVCVLESERQIHATPGKGGTPSGK